ncbi:hypothetical protein BIV23_40995 [Streptomyces monashensis]|uniref:Uncharacterized protein n=2 Tax=Streptomyces monashensis TaxID=1678012 RepID=A0A1S2P8M3_9ACTN|nr:hypothetical protein BIV23_40995 [Streptomyces monashensis]
MSGMNVRTARPRWWLGLRGFGCFLLGGGLGFLAYAALTHRPGGPPWGGLLLGALVCGVMGALFPGRRRR